MGMVACGVVTSPSPPTSFGGAGAFFEDASASGGGDAASSCHPSDVLTFVQSTYQPATAPSDACLGGDGGGIWEDFYEACLGPDKSNDLCTSFKQTPANAACAACVLTPAAADQLGPILSFGEFVGGNVAGCIEITTPSDTSCAKNVQALTDCETAACQANCPVTDPTSLQERQDCVTAADQLGCQSFAGLASTCRAAEADAGLAAPCMNAGFKDFYDEVVPLFCGQVAIDAGAGVSFDAGSSDAALSATDGDAEPEAPDAGSD